MNLHPHNITCVVIPPLTTLACVSLVQELGMTVPRVKARAKHSATTTAAADPDTPLAFTRSQKRKTRSRVSSKKVSSLSSSSSSSATLFGFEGNHEEIEVARRGQVCSDDSVGHAPQSPASGSSDDATRRLARKHTILLLDGDLQLLPWESLPCLRGQPVSRVVSVDHAMQLLSEPQVSA